MVVRNQRVLTDQGQALSRQAWLLGVAVVILTAIVYARVASFDFVYLDDHAYITENEPFLEGFSLDAVTWAFTTNTGGNWHPLVWFSFYLDQALYGLNAGGYHVTNLAFHLGCTWLLFLFLWQATRREWPAALVALLFALHPLHVESVAWVSERKDVVSTFFWLLTMVAYLHYARRPSTRRYLAVLAAMAAGVMSKPMVVTLPCVLLLLDLWPLRRLSLTDRQGRYSLAAIRQAPSRLWWEKVPLLGMSLGTALITLQTQSEVGAMHRALPYGLRIKNAIVSYSAYLWDTVWPTGLQVYYMHPGSSIKWGHVVLSLVVLLALTGVVIWRGRKRPCWWVGWLWYVGTLVPVIGIVQVGGQARADRYTYVPLIGIFFILCYELPRLLPADKRRAILTPLVSVLMALMVVLCWQQVGHWRHTTDLFEHAVRVNPRNAFAYNNLGAYFAKEGDQERAMSYYDQALAVAPGFVFSLHNKGLALYRTERSAEALPLLLKARRLAPNDRDVPITLGLVQMNLQRYQEALDSLQAGLRLNPNNAANIRNSMTVALIELERYGEALGMIDIALQDQPQNPDFLENRGLALAKLGRHAEALEAYQAAESKNPEDARLLNRIGLMLYNLQRYDQADAYLKRSLALDPELVDAWINRGTLLGVTGRHAEAEAAFRQATELDPDNSTPWFNLGKLMQDMGRDEDAWPIYRQAMEMGYQSAPVRFLLGIQAYGSGDYQQAATDFRLAAELDPQLTQARVYRAAALAAAGRASEAEELYQELLRQFPSNAELRNNYGALLVNLDRLEDAEAQFQSALKLRPDYPEAQQNLAKVRQLQDR